MSFASELQGYTSDGATVSQIKLFLKSAARSGSSSSTHYTLEELNSGVVSKLENDGLTVVHSTRVNPNPVKQPLYPTHVYTISW